MSLIWTLIIGVVIGAIAKLLMPGKDPGGFIVTMLLGIAGAFGLYAADQSAGFIASIVGAVILLAIYRMFTRRRASI